MYSPPDLATCAGEIDVVAKKKARQARGVAAVDRAIAIVAAVESRTEPCSLAELSAMTDLYKSTILRLLISLEGSGYITRLPDGRYSLGPMTFRLGLSYERANPLREIVLPVLQGLVQDGTESASLHIRRDETSRLCVLRVDSNHSTLDRVQAGDILPIERGAAGRILLAFSDEPGRLYHQLRQNYFAMSVGERDPACAGVACPVFGPDGTVRGALSLSGPRERFTPAAIARMRDRLFVAAKDVTMKLGGKYPEVSEDSPVLASPRKAKLATGR